MQDSLHLLRTRRFLPIFTTQFLGAFNDNLFRTAMVMLVIYGIYRDAEQEAAFSAIAGGLFILPFFLLSALAGQLADALDKAKIVRIVKTAEIVIMLFGAAGLLLHNVPLLLLALTAMGVHSTFFGPIKYAILPQHMRKDEVLGATGLVEAGPISGSLRARSLAGSSSFSGATAASMPSSPPSECWSSPPSAGSPEASCPLPRLRKTPKFPATRIAGWTGTSSGPRSLWSAPLCT